MTPREASGWEKPERPDPREREVRGTLSVPRLRGPGILGKGRSVPRAPADLEGERSNSHKSRVILRPGV